MCAAIAEETFSLCKEAIVLIDKNLSRITPSPQSIIFIGNTGVGKTSLINLIAGVSLKAIYDEATDHRMITAPNPLADMQIGHSLQSKTGIPYKWVSQDGVAFWDCPGFNDNRGPLQELVNEVCLKKLFEVSSKTKIVVVIKDSDILEPRAVTLMSVVRRLSSLFNESIAKFRKSTILVVSHATETRNIKQVKENLAKVVKEIKMDDSQSGILDALINNPITIFPIPSKEGKILPGKEEVIKNLQGVVYAEGMKANVALSNESQTIVLGSYNMISKSIDQEIEMFLTDFSEAIKKFAEASRLRRERDKLQKLVIQLNGALTEKDSSIAGIAKIANRCFEIMRACAKNVQKEKILQSITQLNTKMFLEKFISFKKDTEIFSKFQKKILESKRFIERTI